MSIEKAYQEVIAGRIREDEQNEFFGSAIVCTPERVTGFYPTATGSQPSITKDHLNGEGVGKADGADRNPNLDAYDFGSLNVD